MRLVGGSALSRMHHSHCNKVCWLPNHSACDVSEGGEAGQKREARLVRKERRGWSEKGGEAGQKREARLVRKDI